MNKKITNFSEYKKINNAFNTQLKMMCKKVRPHNVLIISGDPGIGKTYAAQQLFENQTDVNYVIERNSISAVELYKLMWQHPDAVIILDDVNKILKDANDGASLLKAATDSYPVRKLCWHKQNHNCIPVSAKYKCQDNNQIVKAMEDYVENASSPKLLNAYMANKTFPDVFYFSGAVIILTNKSLKSFDRVTEGAVSNRGVHMEISFTIDGMLAFLKEFSKTFKSYNGNTLSKKTIAAVMKFLTSKEAIEYYHKNGKILSIRNLGDIAAQYQNGVALTIDLLDHNTEFPYYN